MGKTASDPFFGTNVEPITAARRGASVTPSDTADLLNVTSSLLVSIGEGGTGVAVIFANEQTDTAVTIIPLQQGSYQLNMQVRRVMATGTDFGSGGGAVALWS